MADPIERTHGYVSEARQLVTRALASLPDAPDGTDWADPTWHQLGVAHVALTRALATVNTAARRRPHD